jgi:cyanate permease
MTTKPANALRGEVTIELEGVAYTLRPSYEAIVEIERLTDDTLVSLAQAGLSFTMPLAKTAIVATELIKAHGRATEDHAMAAFNVAGVGGLIFDAGSYQIGAIIGAVLSGAASGAYTPSGERKATETKT